VAAAGLLVAWWTGVQAEGEKRRGPVPVGEIGIGIESYADAARVFDARLKVLQRDLAKRPNDPALLGKIASYHWQHAYMLALDGFMQDPAAARLAETQEVPRYESWMRARLVRDETGDLRKAAHAARLALERERRPEPRWILLRQLSRVECARGRHDAERTALEAGVALRPGDQEALRRLARAARETGDRLTEELCLERVWRAERSAKGSVEAAKSACSAVCGPADGVWSSSAPDGDDWLQAIYFQ
jgi:hypothetical protein